MTINSIMSALELGQKVCFKTSRYEVLEVNGRVMYKDLNGTVRVQMDEQDASQCFIKTDWND